MGCFAVYLLVFHMLHAGAVLGWVLCCLYAPLAGRSRFDGTPLSWGYEVAYLVGFSALRVPSNSGNQGKPGKSVSHFPDRENSGNLIKTANIRENSGNFDFNLEK